MKLPENTKGRPKFGPNKTMLDLIDSDDPGCGRKFEPKLCLLRRSANLLKEERGIRPDGDLCAYCPNVIEYEKSMEVKTMENKYNCSKCAKPISGNGKTGLCRSCAVSENAKKASAVRSANANSNKPSTEKLWPKGIMNGRILAPDDTKKIDFPGVGHCPAPEAKRPSLESIVPSLESIELKHKIRGTISVPQNHNQINEFVKKAHENARSKGWHEKPRTPGEIIALMHSELSEALEEIRNDRPVTEIYYNRGCKKPEGVPIELADVIIRIMDFCGLHGIDLTEAIVTKMAYNATRPHRHGGKKL